jgi:hypothetical protein
MFQTTNQIIKDAFAWISIKREKPNNKTLLGDGLWQPFISFMDIYGTVGDGL